MLDGQAVEKLLARAKREVDEGLLPSCQLALGFEGEIVVNEVFGDSTTDTPYMIYSATKVLVSSAAWQLIGRGDLDVTLPVAHYVPEFAANWFTRPTAASVSTQPGDTRTTQTPFGLTSLDKPLL